MKRLIPPTFIFSSTATPEQADGDVQRPDQTGLVGLTVDDDSASESLAEIASGEESRGVSSVLSSAASEGEAEGGGGVCGLGFSRPGSDTYLTASDDSSSVFDDDMQRAERPGFGLLGPSDGSLEGSKEGEDEESRRVRLEESTSEELNKRFQSQRLDSNEPNSPSAPLTSALTPKRPTPPQDPRDNPASPKQPRLRTPAGLGLINASLSKKHLSQPPLSAETTDGKTRNALSMLHPLSPLDTDPDQRGEAGMETTRRTPPKVLPRSQAPALPGPKGDRDSDVTGPDRTPPTPPLHRLPSWVRPPLGSSSSSTPVW